MEPEAYSGLICLSCGSAGTLEGCSGACPACGGILEADYELEAVDTDTINRDGHHSMWAFDALLPVGRGEAVSLGEGDTPLLACADIAAELGVDQVFVKDEGQNPTGSIADRGLAVCLSMVQPPSIAIGAAGDAGQSAAAYGARAGVESHVFLPARAPFASKAMVNVHGADMTVVGGRRGDATAAAESTAAEEGWSLIQPFGTPGLVEGAKTAGYELLEALDWTAPDAIVCPTGTGTTLVGVSRAMQECRALGLIEDRPRLYAAQAAGCAPIVEAVEAGADEVTAVEVPDTICGELEVAKPRGGSLVLEAIRDSDGGAVATEDPAILDSATAIAAATGLELGPAGAAAASGAWELADRDELRSAETVVLINPGGAVRSADVLRSHLMGQGI
ncbi:MAG: pyridoxal-phosphate dependent enzyme [Natrialbaceae archaeon]|nr:pyridoxal-phosphate dependent enzyme [Natrialbaceae archaeon]